ncbi:protein kinase [Pyxidicoccus fallax]|uniref:non-specific serine/threonine protein kinase n=1 Tax=Pyxidicoccus fallax TaxID=394095 RepID=A0A848LGU4_9BACT|nr:serine/threonine-protein kinase [Pyxidicoccus fallax]NMO15358.1 protein kinase [Pyxidicoccus fallax]NPC77278.1 protein kinase [Pyxidicoccus fallax]
MSDDSVPDAGLPPHLRPFARSTRFQLLGRLGEGGMGTVYRVHDRELRRDVALKVMRHAGPSSLHALKREFRSRAGLSHPNLVQLHDLIVGEDYCCFSMELVDGVDFLRWVRPESPCARRTAAPLPPEALARLRAVLAQLVRGLRALHASGLVHRDIKPSNVLVAPEGRVVIVDFGLATELHERLPARGGASGGGTLPYMAPEQLRGGPLTPASDLYAVGLVLYEALTGLRPFRNETGFFLTGDAERLLQRRLSEPPPDPRALVPGIPDDLAELTLSLLSPEPGARPDADALLARLASAGPPGEDGSWRDEPLFVPPKSSFVGRAAELEVLDDALRCVSRRGQQLTVHVHGPSGIGKSTLLREFLRRQGELLVLRGRCHPREAVAYPSLDPIIDALAAHLSTLRDEALTSLVPEHAHALVRLFPVLGRVSALRGAPVPAALPEDVELRRLGIEALRELLTRLARGGPLVVWMDDAHWGDADSSRLVEQLLREPEPPALLLVLTYRSGDGGCPSSGSRPDLPKERVRLLPLGPLAAGEVRVLARRLLEGTPVSDEVVRSLATQSGGSPFVVGEAARYLASVVSHGEAVEAGAPLELHRLLAERLRVLPPLQRALVELAAVAGVPVPRDVLLAGAGLDPGGRTLVSALCDASLLRLAGGERAEAVTTYHDCTREAALARLGDATRARRHRALAEALEHAGSDNLELLMAQWLGAGEPVRAGGYAVRAADRAAHALAFDHAARLYEQGLALLGDAGERAALLERRGDVLASLGRRVDAADCYLKAAEAMGGAKAEPVRALRRRAAEQFIQCGRVEEGWRLLRAVLEEVGVPVPRTRRHAMLSAVWSRLRFVETHREPRPRAHSQVPAAERPRLEALWTAATSLAQVDAVLADAFRMRYLRRVLEVGDASSVCRALAFEAALEAHLQGGWMDKHCRKLLGQVERLARWTLDARDEGWSLLAQATRAFTHGQWREAVRVCERGEAILRERCTGVCWELDMFAAHHHGALALRGELRRLGARLECFLEDSTRRGDIFGIIESCLGDCLLPWLARGQGSRAWRLAEPAVESLARGSGRGRDWNDVSQVGPARRASYCLLLAHVHSALYEGQPWRAWREVRARWDGLYRATPSLRFYDAHVRHARARAALAAAERLEAGQAPPVEVEARWTRRALLADARVQARRIGHEPLPMAAPLSALVRAGVARLEGDVDAARTLLAQALVGFGRADMALHREVTRYALGALTEGPEAAAHVELAEAWMEDQGVVDTRALVATLAPGLGIQAAPNLAACL